MPTLMSKKPFIDAYSKHLFVLKNAKIVTNIDKRVTHSHSSLLFTVHHNI